jgi:hypothetical protein
LPLREQWTQARCHHARRRADVETPPTNSPFRLDATGPVLSNETSVAREPSWKPNRTCPSCGAPAHRSPSRPACSRTSCRLMPVRKRPSTSPTAWPRTKGSMSGRSRSSSTTAGRRPSLKELTEFDDWPASRYTCSTGLASTANPCVYREPTSPPNSARSPPACSLSPASARRWLAEVFIPQWIEPVLQDPRRLPRLRISAERDLSADTTEAVLIPPSLQTGRTHLQIQASAIAQLVRFRLRSCVVDSGRRKGVVGSSHDGLAGLGCEPYKWRNLEDFSPAVPPKFPPNWRDFAFTSETQKNESP